MERGGEISTIFGSPPTCMELEPVNPAERRFRVFDREGGICVERIGDAECRDKIWRVPRYQGYVERTDTSQRVPTIVTRHFLAGITRMAFKAEILVHRDEMSIVCQRRERSGKN